MSDGDLSTSVEYRTIARFPGFRFGSDAGVQTSWTMGVKPKIGGEWRTIKASPRPTGHSWVRLGSQKTTKPHRLDELICEAFHGERPPGAECLHRDGDRTNCLPSNLLWGVAPENSRDQSVEYRRIPECGDGYEFGPDGSIWSSWGTGNNEPGDVWRRLNGTRLESGHIQVVVKWNGEVRRFGAHHLICWAFHGPCPEGLECCHGDGVPDHNESGNLRWGTSKDNAGDQVLHGVMPRGDRHWASQFLDDEVIALRHEYVTTKVKVIDLAKRHGVSNTTMSGLLSGQTYKHLPGAVEIRPGDFRKLSDEQEEELCSLADSGGWTLRALGAKFGVTKQTAANILARRALANRP